MSFKVGPLISRYSIVILLPTFVVSTIYADYSYTQKWKQQKIKNTS